MSTSAAHQLNPSARRPGILIEDAVRRGVDTRIGLEDTLRLPDGSIAQNIAARSGERHANRARDAASAAGA